MTTTLELRWAGDVATICLNDPPSLNAVSLEMLEALNRALDEAERKGRAMVLTGAGKAFCSGANLFGGITDVDEDARDFDAGKVLETHINPLMSRLRGLAVPWIASVRGAAAGVGASLALAGDLVIASETAFFLQAFSKIGLVPDGGSSHLLVRTIGRPRAMELMLLGDRLPARTALGWGLINRVVADDVLDAEVSALAERLASGAASIRSIRKLAWMAVDSDWDSALASERRLQRDAGGSVDYVEGVAAFREKRPARFIGQ